MSAVNLTQKVIPSINKQVRLENVGSITHVESSVIYERLIAGNRIPDSQRKAYNSLRTVQGALSGDLGFVDFALERPKNTKNLDSIYVAFIGVEPEKRMKGVGRCLMKGVEDIGKERDIHEIYGYINISEKSDPTDFFRKLGYMACDGIFCKVF